jgi:hypothetical protein
MNTPLPLRHRFTLLALLLGLLLSGLSALALLRMAEDYEATVSAEILRGQAMDYGERLARGEPVQLPATHRLRGYRAAGPALPAGYAQLSPGMHEDPANQDIHVGVFDTRAGRMIFAIDMGDIELAERHLHGLVMAMMVLGTALAGWLGWLLAGIALQPLRRLAQGVEALPVQPQATHLAANISRDALGQLATAIDAYQARLVDADAHEQAFLADASHELRTPLTVIQGVTEVLLDEPATATTQRSRLLRLERGVGDMGQLLEAMLASARRKPLLIETVNMRSLLQAAAAHAVVGKPAVQLCIEGEATVHTAQREALLLLSGLLRVLLQAQPCERVFVQLAMPLLVLRLDTPPDTPHDPAAGATASFGTRHRADTSTGSALLDRLATRLHWQVQLQSSSHARLLLADTPAA